MLDDRMTEKTLVQKLDEMGYYGVDEPVTIYLNDIGIPGSEGEKAWKFEDPEDGSSVLVPCATVEEGEGIIYKFPSAQVRFSAALANTREMLGEYMLGAQGNFGSDMFRGTCIPKGEEHYMGTIWPRDNNGHEQSVEVFSLGEQPES